MKAGFSLTSARKLFYGLGDVSLNIAYTAIGFYFIFFLVNVAGIAVEWAGIIFLAARLWDAVTDYAMGIISDRTVSRWGRRKPYMFAGALPMAISFALLWIVPFDGPAGLPAYYLLIIIVFNTAFTMVSVPYGAMMPELTQDYDERTSLSAYRMASSFVGNLFAAAGVALIVDSMFGGAAEYRRSYPVMGAVMAVFILLFLSFPLFGVREKSPVRRGRSMGLLQGLRAMAGLREFRYAFGIFLFNMTALDIFMALVVFFLKDILAIPEELTFVILGIPLVSAVAAAPFWSWYGQKKGKRHAYVISVVLMTFCMLMFNLVPAGSAVLTITPAVIAGFAISALQIIPFSILPDVIEFDEKKNGVRREGEFYGISTFLYKLASAGAVAVASFGLGLSGYIEGSNASQPHRALLAVRLIFTFGTILFLLISGYLAIRLPITRERFENIRGAVPAPDSVSP